LEMEIEIAERYGVGVGRLRHQEDGEQRDRQTRRGGSRTAPTPPVPR
jgi:hypothetical protein